MISVLCPSRGRPAQLRESLDTVKTTAHAPDAIEILVAVDPDDLATLGAIADDMDVQIWVAPERYGYARASLYWNELAARARGRWLMLWNDDALMVTPGWDSMIHASPPGLLWSYTRDDDPAGNYFPIWPAEWAKLLGYVCPIEGPHVDTYLTFLGVQLGRTRRVPIEVEHTRPDYLHPEANDATYREGRLLLGSHGMSPGWDRATVTAAAVTDAARIKAAGL